MTDDKKMIATEGEVNAAMFLLSSIMVKVRADIGRMRGDLINSQVKVGLSVADCTKLAELAAAEADGISGTIMIIGGSIGLFCGLKETAIGRTMSKEIDKIQPQPKTDSKTPPPDENANLTQVQRSEAVATPPPAAAPATGSGASAAPAEEPEAPEEEQAEESTGTGNKKGRLEAQGSPAPDTDLAKSNAIKGIQAKYKPNMKKWEHWAQAANFVMGQGMAALARYDKEKTKAIDEGLAKAEEAYQKGYSSLENMVSQTGESVETTIRSCGEISRELSQAVIAATQLRG